MIPMPRPIDILETSRFCLCSQATRLDLSAGRDTQAWVVCLNVCMIPGSNRSRPGMAPKKVVPQKFGLLPPRSPDCAPDLV